MCTLRIVVVCKRKSEYIEIFFEKIRDTIVCQLSYKGKIPMVYT